MEGRNSNQNNPDWLKSCAHMNQMRFNTAKCGMLQLGEKGGAKRPGGERTESSAVKEGGVVMVRCGMWGSCVCWGHKGQRSLGCISRGGSRSCQIRSDQVRSDLSRPIPSPPLGPVRPGAAPFPPARSRPAPPPLTPSCHPSAAAGRAPAPAPGPG